MDAIEADEEHSLEPQFPAQDDAPLGAAENHEPGSGESAAAPQILSREEFLTKWLAERGGEVETLKERVQELEDVLIRVTRDLVQLLDKDAVSHGEERTLLRAALNGLHTASESDEQWNAQCGIICHEIESYLVKEPPAFPSRFDYHYDHTTGQNERL